jgi:hypothetical protein
MERGRREGEGGRREEGGGREGGRRRRGRDGVLETDSDSKVHFLP